MQFSFAERTRFANIDFDFTNKAFDLFVILRSNQTVASVPLSDIYICRFNQRLFPLDSVSINMLLPSDLTL